MQSNMKSAHFARTKITPLFLLSQVKKSSQPSSTRQSMLSFMQEEHKKIEYKYGHVLKSLNSLESGKKVKELRIKTESTRDKQKEDGRQRGSTNEDHNYLQRNKTALSKIDEIIKSQISNKKKFNSLQKSKNEDSREASPYFRAKNQLVTLPKRYDDQDKRKEKLNQESENELAEQRKITTILKQKVLNKMKSPTFKAPKNLMHLQKQRQLSLSIDIDSVQKVFIHFQKIHKVMEALQNNKKEKQAIEAIKKYTLQNLGDPAGLQNIYLGSEACQKIKHILFMERVLVILIVDSIINGKFKLVQVFVHSAFRVLLSFYLAAYKDLQRVGKSHKQMAGCLYLQQQSKNIDQFKSLCFYNDSLACKLKACLKYSKSLLTFFKQKQKIVSSTKAHVLNFKLLQYYSLCLLSSRSPLLSIDFLQTCPSPYLTSQPSKKFTLLLDLDETLIHFKPTANTLNKGQFLIRPYMFEFLAKMSQFYELGIFTCSMPEYADIIINHMKEISMRFYRHHTIKIKGEYIKDLSRVGRSLKNIILVDNLESNFRLQKQNGIHVRSWYGDKEDEILKQLGEELERVAKLGIDDLRGCRFERKFL